MTHEEAYAAIAAGVTTQGGVDYLIERHPKGWCDGCEWVYKQNECPPWALKICLKGGNIIKKIGNE